MRRIISPWEYRHLRTWAGARMTGAAVLVTLAVVTLSAGGNDWKTYSWSLAFCAAGAANLAYACWELSIARSQVGRA
jgi:NhaP-type Na+/H+ or K+/H+ antiporter